MNYRVKDGHMLYYRGRKYKAGTIVDLTEEQGQRWHAIVEPVKAKAKAGIAPETPQEPAGEPSRAVEGEEAPPPKPKRRRRAASA